MRFLFSAAECSRNPHDSLVKTLGCWRASFRLELLGLAPWSLSETFGGLWRRTRKHQKHRDSLNLKLQTLKSVAVASGFPHMALCSLGQHQRVVNPTETFALAVKQPFCNPRVARFSSSAHLPHELQSSIVSDFSCIASIALCESHVPSMKHSVEPDPL